MENEQINDTQLSQSSYFQNDSSYGPSRGRLNINEWPYGSQMVLNDPNPWFQIDLLQQKYVTGLATQGYNRNSSGAWVASYQISWSNDGSSWSLYHDDENPKVKKKKVTKIKVGPNSVLRLQVFREGRSMYPSCQTCRENF